MSDGVQRCSVGGGDERDDYFPDISSDLETIFRTSIKWNGIAYFVYFVLDPAAEVGSGGFVGCHWQREEGVVPVRGALAHVYIQMTPDGSMRGTRGGPA